MAMNNWGGMREHMSKKPKGVFEKRKSKIGLSSKKNGQEIMKQSGDFSSRKNWWGKKDIVFLIVVVILSGGVVWWFFR